MGRRWVFHRWCHSVGCQILDAGGAELEAFLAVEGVGWGAGSRRRIMGDIAALYRFLRSQGLTEADPAAEVEAPRRRRGAPRPVNRTELGVALEGGRLEDRRAVAFMAYAGLRCCELAGLRGADVDVVGGLVHVEGKGGQRRAVWITPPLTAWLAQVDGLGADEPVYPGRRGGPIGAPMVSRRVGEHCRELGLVGVTAHRFRHTYATRLYAASGDLGVVRDQLGHASSATTEVYALVGREAVRQAVAAF